ncbi:uncharacterized protein TNCV_1757351 [Trichonephila clavipes]|nr:uncharacterized protein TNCV_1757351 [Trichonephila clavipes]
MMLLMTQPVKELKHMKSAVVPCPQVVMASNLDNPFIAFQSLRNNFMNSIAQKRSYFGKTYMMYAQKIDALVERDVYIRSLHAEIVEVEIEVVSPSIVPSGNFAELNRTVTCMVLKTNDRRTSCPCHDEFHGPRSNYVRQQTAENQTFPADVSFIDEASFTRSGMFNMHKSHLWAHVNPHGTITHVYQERFSNNVWVGIVHNNLVGPYILPSRLTGRTYNIFLQEVLPELLVDVPPSVRSRMWFQHDGDTAHFSRNVRNHLDTVYGQHWIGRGGPVPWPPRSPDLSCLDFFS